MVYAHDPSASANRTGPPGKRPLNVSLDPELVNEARRLKINLSKACERGLAAQIAESRAAAWSEEARAALLSSNDYVDRHGLPLARLRRF